MWVLFVLTPAIALVGGSIPLRYVLSARLGDYRVTIYGYLQIKCRFLDSRETRLSVFISVVEAAVPALTRSIGLKGDTYGCNP